MLFGMSACAGAMYVDSDRWWASVPLAIMSHWPLDDMNIGEVGRIWHGTDPVSLAVRSVIIAAIAYLCILHWWQIPTVGLIAWLSFDHEWIVGWIIGRHGYGLHKGMWMRWMYDRRGFIPILAASIFYVVALV